ncbi:SGNH/GDSL hydrolase family protein [Alicyclobacillus vulcanalis]|uniref:Lysophospholipase L1 n=1 Tax=Alicyclobacillus vulcanalis TaxID=252246 RepID=A0A1N7JLW1_9BACL|nr:SGNH/GDSL hydrolase family protein [Alicyclobacillus vulcanalis]SIS50244.1 Lysophospholipase L1 [Alicyclobacillus vulcanalis]
MIEPGSKLVMVGDSITDCGRAQPVGESPRGGLGNGYVALVDAHLQALHPASRIRVINVGTSGNTVADVARRWDDEVMALQPDYVSLMIGINDVWRQFDMPLVTERHVGIDLYTSTLQRLVKATKPRVREMVLLSPFYLEPNRYDPMRKMVNAYIAAMRDVAAGEGVLFVDVQAEFDKLLRDVNTWVLAPDRVHPYLNGHLVIARAFLAAIGAL